MAEYKRIIKTPSQGRRASGSRRSFIMDPQNPTGRRAPHQNTGTGNDLSSINYNGLNDILTGKPDRITRYSVYDLMDGDADVARALDMIADHCTKKNEKNKLPFDLEIEEDQLSLEDIEIMYEMLKAWCRLNRWDNLCFEIFRNVIKYGDAFFMRDENFKLFPISAANVLGVYVNQETSEIEGYHCTGLRRILPYMLDAKKAVSPQMNNRETYTQTTQLSQQTMNLWSAVIPTSHMVHLSLNPGREVGGNGATNDEWPFGISILEKVYRDYKVRSLLEDAETIHRMQRAPTRRVFYIGTGKMRPDQQRAEIRRVRNEITQKRIPSKYGGGDVADSIYNPISQMEDLFLAVGKDGQGTTVDTLDGQAWTNDGALKHFSNKVIRGLRVPTSFMLSSDEGGGTYNDGRLGTAYMEEYQFSGVCERFQDLLDNDLDWEFKLYLNYRDVDVDYGAFDLKFTPPMNFDVYREESLLQSRLGLMGSASGIGSLSERFKLEKYLGLTEDEMLRNEQLYIEENLSAIGRQMAQNNNMGGMGIGLGGSFDGGMGDDFGMGGMGDEFGMSDGGIGGGMGGMSGGMGDNAGGMGRGIGGGMGRGIGGGMGNSPTGFESLSRQSKNMLIEAMRGILYAPKHRKDEAMKNLKDLMEDNLVKSVDSESITTRVSDDDPMAGNDDGQFGKRLIGTSSTKPQDRIIPLSHIRKLRIQRQKHRDKMIARLMILPQIYGNNDDQSMF